MLTLNTPIPSIHRGKIRSIVKNHSGWDAWYKAKGILSAQVTNTQLIEFALQYPSLVATIEMILGQTPPAQDIAQDMQNAFDAAGPQDAAQDDAQDEIQGPVWIGGPSASGMATAAPGFDLDSVLAPVDQFLAPLVRKELASALGALIDAANRGPVEIEKIVEVERIVEVAPGEGPRPVALPKGRRDKKTTFRTLYPSRAKDAWRDAQITLWTGTNAPVVDPYYVVDHQQMATFMTAVELGSNVWLTGPSASGKSTLPEQAAAMLGRDFVKIGFSKQTDVDALVGGPGLKGGNTQWEDGSLVKAMRRPGTIILIDEITFAPAGVQAIIQLSADDHRTLTLPTGEVVTCADGVVFVVADNTRGYGDEGGLYQGTNVSNVALVTRFARMIVMDYLSAKKEAEALANHTRCPMPAAEHVADFVAQIRRMPQMAGIVLSLRQMVAFVKMVQQGFTSKDAFEACISSRMPAAERATIEGLATLVWNEAMEALIHGTAVPATPLKPSDSAASQAFANTTSY